jgi:hypothetical protein
VENQWKRPISDSIIAPPILRGRRQNDAAARSLVPQRFGDLRYPTLA